MQAVHDAEDLLERCKLQAEEARERLQQVSHKTGLDREEREGGSTWCGADCLCCVLVQVRLKLRTKRKEFQGSKDEHVCE